MAKHDPRVPFMMRALDKSALAYKLAGLLCWRYGDNRGGSTFPAQVTLAADLRISIRHLRDVIDELKPIGLKVRIRRGPRAGKDLSFYSFGEPDDPTIPEMSDPNASRNSGTRKPKSARNSGTGAPPISEIWSNNSGTDSTTTQKNTQERERAARATLAEAPGFENFEVKEGEILPPLKSPGQGRGTPTPIPPDWQPDSEGWSHAAEHLTADEIDIEVQAFRDYYAANGKPIHDRSAAWRRWVGTSRRNPRNRRPTPASRAAELARELEAKEAALRAAGLDASSLAAKAEAKAREEQARQEAEASRQRAENGPPWSSVVHIIKRKVPPGEAFNKAERSFRLRGYQDGVLDIAVENGHLYPPSSRESVGSYIRSAFPYLTDVRWNDQAAS
jgi:hypothetical protein